MYRDYMTSNLKKKGLTITDVNLRYMYHSGWRVFSIASWNDYLIRLIILRDVRYLIITFFRET